MKPIALSVNADAIPNDLTREDRWVLWRYVEQHSRWTKIPCQTNGHYAKPNDASTWASFDDVIAAYQTGYPVAGNWNDILKLPFDGLGFCLGDGWAGIDFDHCLHDGNLLEQNALAFIERVDVLGAYREVSPSGEGIKVIGRSARMGGEINFDTEQRVPFSASRFFAVTGAGSMGAPVDITSVIHEWFPQAPTSSPFGPAPSFVNAADAPGQTFDTTPLYPKLNDRDVVAAIMASPQAPKFRALAAGDMSEYGDDHSRADQALINILAYWCQGDRDQIVRLFTRRARTAKRLCARLVSDERTGGYGERPQGARRVRAGQARRSRRSEAPVPRKASSAATGPDRVVGRRFPSGDIPTAQSASVSR
jgi:putative DNA primase/helicase